MTPEYPDKTDGWILSGGGQDGQVCPHCTIT